MKKEVFEPTPMDYELGQEYKFAIDKEKKNPCSKDMNYFAFEL